MKKLIAILACVALLGICSSVMAAEVLSDKEMGELYAGRGGDNEINDVDKIKDSAVSAQSNIAAVLVEGALAGAKKVKIRQSNNADVVNVVKGGILASRGSIVATKGGTIANKRGRIKNITVRKHVDVDVDVNTIR